MIKENIYLGVVRTFEDRFERLFPLLCLFLSLISVICSVGAKDVHKKLSDQDDLKIAKNKGLNSVFRCYRWTHWFIQFLNFNGITSEIVFFDILLYLWLIFYLNWKKGLDIDSFEYNHCSIHSDCSEGTNNTIDYVKYVFDINDKSEKCPNLASSYHHEENLLWYYEDKSMWSHENGQSICHQSEFGCCHIFSTCESYTKPIGLVSGSERPMPYSVFNYTIHRGFPHGYVTTEQPRNDPEGSNCMTDRGLIEYYIEHKNYTYAFIIYCIMIIYAIIFCMVILTKIITRENYNLPRESIFINGFNRLFCRKKKYEETRTTDVEEP
tara:strand:+ start:237 stop:1208 length:972 start_codon:yes stop_codon:yes gene_type:complete